MLKTMFKTYAFAIFAAIMCMFCLNAFAQTSDDLGVFQQALELIKSWGGMNWAGKVAGAIFLIIGLMKVSFLDKVWDFFGEFKPAIPLVLGLLAGVVSLAMAPGSSVTMAGVLAYVTAGAGAILLNSLLDMAKAIPGIGSMWVSVIDFIQIILKANGPKESAKLAAKSDMKASLSA